MIKARKKSIIFIQVYGDFIEDLLPLRKFTQELLMHCIKKHMNQENCFSIRVENKREICNLYNVKPDTISSALYELSKNNFIQRMNTGYYMVNPYYLWIGGLKNGELNQARKIYKDERNYQEINEHYL